MTVYDGQTALGTTTANASGVWSYTTTPLANGTQTFTATATDAAGNTSAASNAVDPIIGPPPAPTIVSFSPDSGTVGDDITNATTLTLTGTGEANSTVEVFDGSTELGTAAVNASGAWSFVTGTLANGSHVFTATDTLSGNASAPSAALTVTVNTVAPTVSSVAASGNGITNGSGDLDAGHVVTLTVTLSEAVTVANGTPTLTLNDGATATYTGGSGTKALTFSYTVAAGQNTPDLTVSAVNLNGATITDGAGNSASLSGTLSPAGTLQIDTTAPGAPVITSDSVNGDNSVTLTGTAEANGTVTVYDGQAALGTTTANASGVWSYTTTPLANGTQTFTATATDAAGNTSAASNAVDPIIGPPPAPTIVSFSPDSGTVGDDITNATTLTLTGTGEANTTVEVFDGSTELGTAAVNASGAWSFVTGMLANGSHVFTATDTLSGNASAASAALTVTVNTVAPTVSSVAASGNGITNGSGDLDAGHAVTLTVTLSEAVTVANGTPTLTLNDGATATYIGGSGTNALTFSYTVAAGQNTSDLAVTGVKLGTATITDAAGNAANLTGAVTNLAGTLQIDTAAPTVKTVTAAPMSGDVESGGNVTITVTMSEIVDVTGTPVLSLNDGGGATYLSGSGTSTLVFSYTVGPEENTTALQLTGALSGGSITDRGGQRCGDLSDEAPAANQRRSMDESGQCQLDDVGRLELARGTPGKF